MRGRHHARKPAAARSPTASVPREVLIERVGARGDGIAQGPDGKIYVPFAIPGERVLIQPYERRGDGMAARLIAILEPSPSRVEPACRHFGRCGGCALQHLSGAAYGEAKMAELRRALASHGFAEVPIAPLRVSPAGSRRRAKLAIERPRAVGERASVGFSERGTHRIVDLAECPVLDPLLQALIEPLRSLAPSILPPGGRGQATLQRSETGIDLLIDLPAAPDLATLEGLARFAEEQDLARLCWREREEPLVVPVAQRRPVRMRFAGLEVELPPDAFLQATPEGEAALSAEVAAIMAGAERIADLFAGVGTFSCVLAQKAAVHAVEGWKPAAEALQSAARRAGIADRLTVENRDLQARPLLAPELARFDGVVFDPPRIGAAQQAAILASSSVPRIAAISCNPASFARDARILAEGGYRLVGLHPIDQFTWSPHLELVAAFRR